MPNVLTPQQLPTLLRPGNTVFIQGGPGEPSAILQALALDAEASAGIHYIGVSIPGVNDFNPARFHPDARFSTFFVHGDLSLPEYAEQIRFLPMHYRSIYDYLATLPRIDIALIQLSPPDSRGMCSFGPSVDFVPAVLGRAQLVVAQINRRLPVTSGAPELHFESLDYVVEADHSLPEPPVSLPSTQLEAISDNVAKLIEDGDTLQTGIGRLPAAILQKLEHHRDLGLHSGMLTAEVRYLIEAGVMTGSRKSIDRGRHVAGIAVGDSALYQWSADCGNIDWRPVAYTHDIRTLAQIDNFVAVNSALEVDLMGQANAEMINGRQVSATGGLLDFIRGARLSRNGRSVIALPATTSGGQTSRLVARLGSDSITSVPRSDVDYVVTEYGIARLAGASQHERAQALISIAAPRFRDELARQWHAVNSRRV